MDYPDFRCLKRSAVLVGFMSLMAPVYAASGASDNATENARAADTLQEVTVTATRRTELPINVPMSISVLGADTLRQMEVSTFNDFATQVTNLSFNYGNPGPNSAYGGNTDDRAVAIRGIQGQDTTGFYLDDLPLPISMTPRVIDIERVEVLRGPQGTLYGARSMGGTIRMITTAPDSENFSGLLFTQGTKVDAGGDGYEVYGTFNVPLVTHTLAFRVTPFRGQDGGYINRVWSDTPASPSSSYSTFPAPPYSDQKNTAETEYYGVDSSLQWTPTSNLTIRPRSIYQHTSVNGLPAGDYSADNLTNYRHFNIPEGTEERFWVNGVTIDYALPVGTVTNAIDILDRKTEDFEDVSEFTNYAFGGSAPFLPSPIYQTIKTHAVNEELRFASTWQSPLQLTAGLYYNRQYITIYYDQPIPGFLPVFGNATVAANTAYYLTDERAAFGELTYNFTPQWSATVGGRYSKDRSDFDLYAWGVVFGPQTEQQVVPGVTPGSGVTFENDNVFTPKVVLKFQPDNNLDIYADAAKGFRPGGGEVAPPYSFCAAQYAHFDLTPSNLSSYRPDWVWSYEVGAKALAPDHRYELNTALFWIDWTNLRQILPLSCGFTALVNSGTARSRGAELEFSAVPVSNLTLSGGLGYDDAKVVNPGPLLTNPPLWWQVPGSQLQQVARLTANFRAAYTIPMRAGNELRLQGDYSYTDHSYTATTNAIAPYVRPAYTLVDLRAALTTRTNTEFAAFCKNVLDQHPNYGEQFSIAGFVPGRLRWETGVPRTFGIEVTQRF